MAAAGVVIHDLLAAEALGPGGHGSADRSCFGHLTVEHVDVDRSQPLPPRAAKLP